MNTTLRLALCAAVLAGAGVARADEKADCISASEKAQSLRDDRKLIEAREQFLACARDVCPAAVKKDCADQVSAVQQRTPSVVFHAKDKTGQDLVSVKVSADGKLVTEQLDGRSIPLDPGVHTFRFEAEGNEPFEQKIVLAEGEHDRPVNARFGGGGIETGPGLAPAAGKKSAPIGAFVVGGIGLVSMAIAPVFYAMGLSQKSTDEGPGGCAPTAGGAGCSPSEIDSIHTKLIVGDVLMFGGAAILATGIIWTIVHYASGGGKEASNPPAAGSAVLFDVAPAAWGRGAVASTTIRW